MLISSMSPVSLPRQRDEQEDEPFEVHLDHAFGSVCSNRDFCGAALFGDPGGDHVVHPVGRRIALQHLGSGETGFLPIESTRVEAVTACAMSRDRRFLAVSERCSSSPLTQVSVYDLTSPGSKPVRMLEELANGVGRILCMAFSSDMEASRLVLASGAPEAMLVLLDWRENDVLARCSLEEQSLQPLSHVAVSPLDESIVSGSGANCIHLWHASKGRLVAQPPFDGISETSEIVDHCWILPYNGNIAACCATQGRIYIVSTAPSPQDPGKLAGTVYTIEAPFQAVASELRHLPEMPLRVRSIERGLLIGGSRGGLSLWVLDEGSTSSSCEGMHDEHRQSRRMTQEILNEMRHDHTIRTRPGDHAITCLDIVPEDRGVRILLGYQDSAIGLTSMHLRGASRAHEAVNLIAGGYHTGAITSLDMARQRPVFATACRRDGTVRVWSYATKHCEVCWDAPNEELTGVAVHPNGYCIAVSTVSKIRFFLVLIGQLKQYRELAIRAVRLLRFSSDGQHLAAAQGRLVVVYSSESMERLAAVRAHGQVIAIRWEEDDTVLVTASEDGQLAHWDTKTWERVKESQAVGLEFFAVSTECGRQSFASVLDTVAMRALICPYEGLERAGEGMEVAGGLRLSALCFAMGPSNSALFAATSLGQLRVHSAPLASLRQYEDIHVHVGAITAMCLSNDSRTLVTAGSDGALFVFTITGLADANVPIITQDDDYVMVSQSEVQRLDEDLDLFSTQNVHLKEGLAETAARLEGESRALVNEARSKDQENIKQLRHRYEVLQQAMTTKERECLRQMKAMENQHLQAADKLEQHYERQTGQEAERLTRLQSEVSQLEEKVKSMQAETQRQLDILRQRHQQELKQRAAEKDAEVQRQQELLAFSRLRFDSMLDQEHMEHVLELNEQKRFAQKELEQQMQVDYRLKKEQDTLLRSLDLMEKDRDRIQKEQLESRAVIHNLELQRDVLTQTVSGLKDERRERESSLRDKELQIGAHKVKVSTLKKFKQVLDFRLREVTLSLQPKDVMIRKLHSQLHVLEGEFEKHLERQRHLEASLESKVQQEKQLVAERMRLQDSLKHYDHTIEAFRKALYDMVNSEVDARRWPALFRKMHDDHICGNAIAHDKEMELPMTEIQRQMRLMDRKISSLTAKNKRTDVDHAAKMQEQTDENARMIEDMSQLRMANKTLEVQVKELELKLQQLDYKRFPHHPAIEDPAEAEEVQQQSMLVLKAADGGSGGVVSLQTVPHSRQFSGRAASASVPPAGGAHRLPKQLDLDRRTRAAHEQASRIWSMYLSTATDNDAGACGN